MVNVVVCLWYFLAQVPPRWCTVRQQSVTIRNLPKGVPTMTNSNRRKAKSKRGQGRLYKRGKDGREYAADSKVQGVYYLEYRVDGKRVR